MDDDNTEVLFESWGLHYTAKAKSSLFVFNPWKKRYLVLYQDDTGAEINVYDRKVKQLNQSSTKKCCFSLRSRYKIEKLYDYKGQNFVCSITSDEESILLAFHDEKLFHLFAFFVQTQTKLREELEDQCFVVRPDNTESQQKIGARGNMCLLHISQYGVILALQLSKCILAWWPLRCIRCYESLSRQQFGLEAGRRAPMGEGIYVFNTRREQDNMIYDRLDNFVMQAAGLRQIVYRSVSQGDTSMDSTMDMTGQLENLQSLATVQPDTRFTSQLQRISRNIYDQLATNHFGSLRKPGSRNSAESATSTDSEVAFNRSASQIRVEQLNHQQPDVTLTPPIEMKPRETTPKRQTTSTPCKDGGTLPANSYENSELEKVTLTSRKMKQQQLASSYLSMSSPAQSSHNVAQGSSLGPLGPQGASAPSTVHFKQSANNNSPHVMDMHGHGQFTSLQNSPSGQFPTNSQGQFQSLPHQPRSNGTPVINYNKNRTGSDSAQITFASFSYRDGNGSQRRVAGTRGSADSDTCTNRAAAGSRAESFPKGERALSNEYTNQLQYSIPRDERVTSVSSDPPTPYEQMSPLDNAVYPPESIGSFVSDEENVYPPAYERKSQMYSYANPNRLRQLAESNAANGNNGASGQNSVSTAQSHEYLYPQNVPYPQGQQQQPSQRLQQSRDLKPPMLKPKPAERPTDLYASPKPKNKNQAAKDNGPSSMNLEPPPLTNGKVSPSKSPGGRSDPYEEFKESPKGGIYESPTQSPQGLAFANNMFKEEINTSNANTVPGATDKPPHLKLSLFHKQTSKPDIGATGRSVSISPITPPHPSGSAARGITLTPNTKSFKRSQPIEHSSPNSPALQTSFGSPSNAMFTHPGQSAPEVNGSGSILRKQKSTGMEGRRLPSLPADAIIGVSLSDTQANHDRESSPQDLPSPTEQQYEKVGADSFI